MGGKSWMNRSNEGIVAKVKRKKKLKIKYNVSGKKLVGKW